MSSFVTLPYRFSYLPLTTEVDWQSHITRGLMHAWRFAERSIGTSYNALRNGKDIVWTSLNGLDQGIFGPVPKFNGTTSRGEVALDLSSTSILTINFWMYWDAFAADDDLAMEFTPSTNITNGSFYIDPNESGGTFVFRTSDGSVHSSTAGFTRPTAAQWHNYSFSFDRSLTTNTAVAAYVDGVSQSLTRLQNDNMSTYGAFANNTLYLMHRNGSGTRVLFGAGRLCNLLLFNRVLSADEALKIFVEPNCWLISYPQELGRVPVAGGVTESPASAIFTFSSDVFTTKLLHAAGSGQMSLSSDALVTKLLHVPGSGALNFASDALAQSLKHALISGVLTLTADAVTTKVQQSAVASAILSLLGDQTTLKLQSTPAAAALTFSVDTSTTQLKHTVISAILSLLSDAAANKLQLTPNSAVLQLLADIIVVGGSVQSPASAVLDLKSDAATTKLLHVVQSAIMTFTSAAGTIGVTQSVASAILDFVSAAPAHKLALLVTSAPLTFTSDLPAGALTAHPASGALAFSATGPNLLLVVRPDSAVLQLLAEQIVIGGYVESPASAVLQLLVDNPSLIIGLFGYERFDRIVQDKVWDSGQQDKVWERIAQKKKFILE